MKFLKVIPLCFISMFGVSQTLIAKDIELSNCTYEPDRLNSFVSESVAAAEELFYFGKYARADASLSDLFVPREYCSNLNRPVIDFPMIDPKVRNKAVVLNVMNLWESGKHDRLESFVVRYLDDASISLWGCRVHLYERRYRESAACFNRSGEYDRSRRDVRATLISEELKEGQR